MQNQTLKIGQKQEIIQSKSIDIYSRLLSNTNLDANKQYSISKVYVMINELQNAVEVQDESVFLIKYKNILEEMNSLV